METTPIVVAVAIAVGIAVYLLPAIIAGIRGHASAWGIFALNLLLGWSGIVWIIALIWALSNKGQAVQQTVIVHNNGEAWQPPQPIYIPVPQPPVQSLQGTTPQPLIDSDTRACPSCAETIKAAAIKCRFCGEQVSPLVITQAKEVGHGE